MVDAERPLRLGFRENRVRGGHVEVALFAGWNPGARGNCGTVTLRLEEWEELREQIDAQRVLVDEVPAQEGSRDG